MTSVNQMLNYSLLLSVTDDYLWDLELCLDFLRLRFDGDSFLIDLDLSISSW